MSLLALYGTLPSAAMGNWSNVVTVRLCCNNIMGSLPSSIGQWTKVQEVSLQTNRLSGTIPSTIGNWTAIQTAILHGNAFTGTMPAEICLVANLSYFEADCAFDEVECPCCTNCS